MKTIISYLKYLKNNPAKIVWLVILNAITQLMGIVVFSSDIYEENGKLVFISLAAFITILHIIGNIHPYKEWKDGKPKSK